MGGNVCQSLVGHPKLTFGKKKKGEKMNFKRIHQKKGIDVYHIIVDNAYEFTFKKNRSFFDRMVTCLAF